MDRSGAAIRRATPLDRDSLIRLAGEFASGSPSSSPSALQDLLNARLGVERVLKSSNSEVLVAEAEGVVAGCAIWASFPSLVHGGRDLVFLDLVVVAAQYRRRGIGTMIMKDLIRLAKEKNAYKIVLTTRGDNQAAIAFHRSLSFSENGLAFAHYIQ
jgi:ribosomal protein S18 acetylase RimI-like enzyme